MANTRATREFDNTMPEQHDSSQTSTETLHPKPLNPKTLNSKILNPNRPNP